MLICPRNWCKIYRIVGKNLDRKEVEVAGNLFAWGGRKRTAVSESRPKNFR
jgi:hypothetical protein